LLHFSSDTIAIPKERYYRLLETEAQYRAQQQETRRLHQLLEEVIRQFDDDPKIIYFKEILLWSNPYYLFLAFFSDLCQRNFLFSGFLERIVSQTSLILHLTGHLAQRGTCFVTSIFLLLFFFLRDILFLPLDEI
jgi:hypothetical protein